MILESSIIGSIFGGLFRLAPEVMKIFDRANERKHELKMFQLSTELEKVKGDYKVEEKYVDYSVAQMQAIQAAAEAEGKIASKTYKWVAAAVALVRPSITYAMFALYLVVKFTFIFAGLYSETAWLEVVKANWTNDDWGVLTMILTFHFVGRPIEKYTSKYGG